ncbi:MAG TPA: tetratricopeptide repeat protein, partial [Rhodospirillales bacterium]|nr:tetratricopeptide repeat protein [Rhodospirillales bacterium]
MRRIKSIAVVLAVAMGLSSCGALQPDIFGDTFWSNGPFNSARKNSTAELGLGELAKGNYIGAEGLFQKALRKNPQDFHALLGLGMIYQNNGQLVRARQMYEAILAIRPDQSEQFIVWKSLATRPISEIASVNLALIESGGVLTSMGRESGVQPEPAMVRAPTRAPMGQPIGGADTGMAMVARTAPGVQASPAAMASAIPRFAEASANIVSRFETMTALRDQGLVTREEFNVRRQANIGALLPLTSPPPAAGLDRSVPNTEQISGRLRAIGRGLQMRAITIAQHTAERSMILDALMPAAPVTVANPGLPPQGLLEAADSVRWLEHLKGQGLITADEYSRERGAIEQAMQPA